ncbi:MAG: ROK family protein [Pseudomonadales bacterium]|nr:ROK family protein [Pseudomonadales bacterium]
MEQTATGIPAKTARSKLGNMQTNHARIGIDLGGTKIEAILLSDNGTVGIRHRVATPKNDYLATLAAIQQVIHAVKKHQHLPDQMPIGIGTPGAISTKTGLLKNCNSTCLNGHSLVADLETMLNSPVRIANDADCFTLSEAVDGAAKNAALVFGVILGTGVGGGITFKQQLLQGANSITGEWGHTTLPIHAYQTNNPDSTQHIATYDCFCGRTNCVETWLSGPGFERMYQSLTRHKLSAEAIINKANEGDNTATLILEQYINLLALALSNIINLLDPNTIVLGGGLSNIPQIYKKLPQYLPRYVFSDEVNTRIVPAQHGDSSGVRGAAWLWSKPEISDFYQNRYKF